MIHQQQQRLSVKKSASSTLKGLTLVLISTLVFSGCRSTREAVVKPTKKDMELLQSLVLEKPAFTTLSSKVDFRLSTKKGISTSMRGSLKLSMDSCMILSLQPFAGIEVAKCMVRTDSFFIVSRLHQLYAAESIKKMPYSSLGLFNLIQKVLINRVFIPGITNPGFRDLSRFSWQKSKKGTKLNLTQNDYSLDYSLNDDQQYVGLRAYTGRDSDNIQVDYSQFEKSDGLLFPKFIEMKANDGKKLYDLQIIYLKPVFNETTDTRFPIPSKYKKVTLDELMKRFDNML